jgi:hypothetical protein
LAKLTDEEVQRLVAYLKHGGTISYHYTYDEGAHVDLSCELEFKDSKFVLTGAELEMHGHRHVYGQWATERAFGEYLSQLESDSVIDKIRQRLVYSTRGPRHVSSLE